jgi:hypothetical protein
MVTSEASTRFCSFREERLCSKMYWGGLKMQDEAKEQLCHEGSLRTYVVIKHFSPMPR